MIDNRKSTTRQTVKNIVIEVKKSAGKRIFQEEGTWS